MAGISKRVPRGLLITALVVLLATPTWADETVPIDPPSVRLQPPVGVTTNARLQPPSGLTTDVRLQPPVGDPQHRIQPPVGIAPEPDQSLMELVMTWLRARISIPTG
jgi:hypothetical protein